MNFGLDYPEDFTSVPISFTTQDQSGAAVAPLTAFESADVKIVKHDGTVKATTNGLTMTSPFNSTVGWHRLVIDTSNDTGDSGFWTAGAAYEVVLVPDTETVAGQTVVRVVGAFSVAMVMRPTVAGHTLDVTATGGAGIDWSNVEAPTTTVGLTGTTIATSQVVASVTARVTANTDQLAGQTVTAAAGVTFPSSVASPTNITAASGVALTSSYDFAKGTTAMTESYAANTAAMTPVQSLHMIWALLENRSLASTTLTAKKLDNSTTAMTFTLDSATVPTTQVRAT